MQKNDLNQRVGPARENSQKLLDTGLEALRTVEQVLGPNLTLAEASLANASKTLAYADDENNAIRLWVMSYFHRVSVLLIDPSVACNKIEA